MPVLRHPGEIFDGKRFFLGPQLLPQLADCECSSKNDQLLFNLVASTQTLLVLSLYIWW